MPAICISNSSARIIVQPELGAGLSCYDVLKDGNWEAIFRRADLMAQHPFDLSSILLVPFSGRVSGGGFAFDGKFFPIERNIKTEKFPIHGSGFSSVWTVSERANDYIVLSLSADGPGPFRYDAVVTYRLKESALLMELAVTNRASIRLPIGAGFHPWFVRDPHTFLTAPAVGVWLEQADHLPDRFDPVSKHVDMDFNTRRPLPNRWINNWFFGWNRTARIEWPRRGLAVEVNTSEDLDQYVVFSPSPEADFFCFEPVDHPVDALNLPGGPELHGMKVLDPLAAVSIATEVRPIRI